VDERVAQILKRLFAVLALLALLWVARAYGDVAMGLGGTAMAMGFLLLTAYVGGQAVKAAGISRVTGYILVGLLVGPGALGLLTEADLSAMTLLNDLAIALIAFTAGGELSLSRLKGMGRYLASITLLEMTGVFVLVTGTVLAVSAWLPFTAGHEFSFIVTVALVFGSVAIANSPSVAIAVITDTRSRGPVSTTVMGVTVIKDVLVIVAFAATLAVAYQVLEPAAERGQAGLGATLAWEIGGSLLVGAVLGVGIAAYLKWVEEHMVLFTLGVAWLAVELAGALHLEVLLLALSAGFTLENLLPVAGHRFVESLESASLPIYALFFSLAGAGVHLDAMAELWYWALLLIAVRAAGIYLGTEVGARVGGAPDVVRRYAWLGFVSQAGVTLGMVTILERSFPTWGAELKTLFVAMVAVHELIGPVVLQWALERAGEVGGQDREEAADAEAADVPGPGPLSAPGEA
jgi:Kef-type K+ transport system membrane component KefB